MKKAPAHVKLGLNNDIATSALLGVVSPRIKTKTTLTIGNCAIIRGGTTIYSGSNIGNYFETGHNVVIREENKIGDGFNIWNNSTVDYGCNIGDGVKIHCNCYVAQYTTLEDNVFLAPGVIIANDLYPGLKASAKNLTGPHLGKGVQVGVNATILPFVHIGANSLIASGAVVTKNIPPNSLVIGNPARIKGKINRKEWTKRLEEKLIHEK